MCVVIDDPITHDVFGLFFLSKSSYATNVTFSFYPTLQHTGIQRTEIAKYTQESFEWRSLTILDLSSYTNILYPSFSFEFQ